MEFEALKAAGLTLAHQTRNVFTVRVPDNITVETLLNSDYWVHVHRKFNMGKYPDRLEIVTENLSQYFEIMVLGKLSLGPLKYRLIHSATDEAIANGVDIDDGKFRVEFAGTSGWRVLKRQGRGYSEMIANLPDQKAGLKWIEDHKQALAA